MTRTIKLSNGEATLREKVNHATKTAHEAALFNGVTIAVGLGDKALEGLELPFANTIAANEALVLGLITKLVIDGKEVAVNKQSLDELDSDDFDLLKDAANEILKPPGKAEAIEKKSKS